MGRAIRVEISLGRDIEHTPFILVEVYTDKADALAADTA